jgi:DNA-binding MarR family transcriptional regulator
MERFGAQVLEGVAVMAAIVEAGTFARAGETLQMSQPGVSRAVARLEGRLGVRLFDRTTRRVRLTDEGRRFYDPVMPLLGALESATAEARGQADAAIGRLCVNIDPFFSRLILGPRWAASSTRTRSSNSSCAPATTWATWWPTASTSRCASATRGPRRADPTEVEVGSASGGTRGEGDGVAEGSEPAGVVAGEAGGAHLVEVVAPELAIRLAVAQDVVGDDEDAVGHGDDGLLVAAGSRPPGWPGGRGPQTGMRRCARPAFGTVSDTPQARRVWAGC